MNRGKKIVRVSIYGILVNIILVAFKAVVGFISNSIAIILDAVNNLTDALSSIVTIVGVKLSEKKPDKKHPFGHGRAEYFSAVVVAVIVLAAGVMAFKESIEKIITPEAADYSVATLVIILATVFVKFFFGRYVKKKGDELNSGSLTASGVDAISDAVLSFSVFVAAMISFIWHVSLEGYLGLIIAVMIIRTAVEILKKGIDDIIGVRADQGLVDKLKKRIMKDPEVMGVYDVTLHNYGPNKIVASVHVQVDDDMTAGEIHRLTRRIEFDVYDKMGIIMTMGIYASNDKGKNKKIKDAVEDVLKRYKNLLQMHGFYVDEEYKTISFDLIFSFDEEHPEKQRDEIVRALKKKYPDYQFSVILDTDISE